MAIFIWYINNKESIKRIREASDKIARSHNLSVIENPKKGTMLSYAEYLAKQNHNTWKDTLRKQINRIILMPDVHTIDDLAKKLELLGYETSGDKYLHIRRKSDKKYKFMSTLKLGDGYGTEELKYRIECKNIIMPLAQINSYSGIQMNSAFYVRQRLNEYKREHNRKLRELDKLNEELKAAAEYRKEIGEHYKTYLEITEPAYERMKREMAEYFDFGEDEIIETYKEDLQECHYFAEMYGGTVTEDTKVDEERLVRAYDKKYQLGDYAPQKNYTTKSYDYR